MVCNLAKYGSTLVQPNGVDHLAQILTIELINAKEMEKPTNFKILKRVMNTEGTCTSCKDSNIQQNKLFDGGVYKCEKKLGLTGKQQIILLIQRVSTRRHRRLTFVNKIIVSNVSLTLQF